ncbi:unnamed protein product [Allacma fusca]|uniref:Uncharacterized protein n=1 Tax=Allacma fusca TaxID=39272 RepID=A0A8J2LTC8_9HEXA|nr:unnamed protein product [Allacma fusca]
MRPSVISFARRKSRHIEILTNADPAEHFLRALGPHLYNMIYGTYYSPFVGSLHDGRYSSLVEMERQHITRERLPVNEHFRKSLGKKTWMEMQGFR